MKLHEYQAKELLKSMNTVVPRGGAATTVDEAMALADELGGNFWVVKAQVHAGGRGKGRFKELVSADVLAKVVKGIPVDGIGGVALCRTREQVETAAKTMLGNTLVTKQTGIGGVVVKTIYVTPGADIKDEIYAAVLLDRQKSQLVLMCSTEGGTEIEEVAEHNPDAIKKVWVDPAVGLGGWQAREMAFMLGLEGKAFKGACKMFFSLVNTYLKYDASLVEINPLIIDSEDNVIALDAKMSLDPNAAFRHKALFAEEDESEKDPYEAQAEQHDLNFIKLDGNIGCMVNGAGLAMATMDIIQYEAQKRGVEASPANFLDVGGSAKHEQIKVALELISKDPSVECILVNIFGGIMSCQVIAEGVLAAISECGLTVPLVVRLSGNKAEEGKRLLAESDLAVITADNLAEAAEKAVSAVQK
ncbi:MAG: ADP-forming succinate--CoA ligase subunit beta [Proteobacteria bacterium]|nr:ADP-forming succinate--CoA ligase subunit beta [Pseudomonadota bacterium]